MVFFFNFCLQCCWGEVRNIVRCIYREAGTSLAGKWFFYESLLLFIYLFIYYLYIYLFAYNFCQSYVIFHIILM